MISIVAIYCVVWLLCIFGTYLLCRDHMTLYIARTTVTSRLTACVKTPTEPVGYVGRASGLLSAWEKTKSVGRGARDGAAAIFGPGTPIATAAIKILEILLAE